MFNLSFYQETNADHDQVCYMPWQILTMPVILILAFTFGVATAQPPDIKNIFPAGTGFIQNVPYANDTSGKHLLDVYLPPGPEKAYPLIVWIHGGAWMLNDKYADMGYMKNTLKGFTDSGYAVASINYRYSTDSVFPAQIRNCNQAIEFLFRHSAEYHIDKDRIGVIGFSAGGHLASLLALSNNNHVKDFLPGHEVAFKIRLALDFYGPSDFLMLGNNPDTAINNMRNPVSILLGALATDRPDLAKRASPVNYIDKNDPPFLIIQGEKDESVPNTQSKVLSAWLTLSGVKNKLMIIPGAPHYGEMFDAENIRQQVFRFLSAYLEGNK